LIKLGDPCKRACRHYRQCKRYSYFIADLSATCATNREYFPD